ncbi:MAG: BrnT family toxin [Nitrospirae bacterium]|nr:MAG: BrnT family toxin [Nitrospirota bacterium]
MKFEWDLEKEKRNRQKHKISFDEACYVFADRFALNLFDADHSTDEERWITLGQLGNGVIIAVSHTFRKAKDMELVRIISARKATKNEMKQYIERRR